jgi:hypothetical protein
MTGATGFAFTQQRPLVRFPVAPTSESLCATRDLDLLSSMGGSMPLGRDHIAILAASLGSLRVAVADVRWRMAA